jgi:hypothetical protein
VAFLIIKKPFSPFLSGNLDIRLRDTTVFCDQEIQGSGRKLASTKDARVQSLNGLLILLLGCLVSLDCLCVDKLCETRKSLP